jgi:indole-3-glycerol phosphate synthase
VKLPDLVTLEGTLGRICRGRLEDYAHLSTDLGAARAGTRGFENAIKGPNLKLIAEVKRSSPRGAVSLGLNALEAARQYAAGGASAISVLTEPRDFNGSLEDLIEVVNNQDLPVLRKDFTVHPHMLLEAADAGASAVLLLVNVLLDNTKAYLEASHHLGLDALVEVHTEAELEIALAAKSRIIGVNNRDLKTLDINLGTAPRVGLLAREYDFEGVLVALSGYSNRAELISLGGVFDAVLVGSSLAGSGSLEASTRSLLGH